jgi:hypothetical protein
MPQQEPPGLNAAQREAWWSEQLEIALADALGHG